MLNKKHNLKSGKAKIRKRDWKEKARQETPQKRKIDEQKKLQLNVLMLFLS